MIVGAEKTSAVFGIVNDPNPIVLMSKNNDRAIESDYISCRWQKPTQQSHSKSFYILVTRWKNDEKESWDFAGLGLLARLEFKNFLSNL
jgi:hypothetical protein